MDFDAINSMMQSETSQATKIWMNWMMIMFLSSLLFVFKFKPARWAVATILGTFVLAAIVWTLTQNVHLFAIPHLILWTPLAIYLWKSTLSPTARAKTYPPQSLYAKAHLLWAALLFTTILISLVFDVRDVYLVMTGGK